MFYPVKHCRLMVQEYLPGKEYSVDCFAGSERGYSIVRERNRIVNGIAFETTICDDTEKVSDMNKRCNHMCEKLGLKYAVGFQFKEDAEGMARLLECNPRVQGTMVATALAGVNMVWMGVKEILGEEIPLYDIELGYKFTRYWGGVGEDGRAI